ncbi:Mpv17-like protein [Frankliniella fusca]|uniref:Mpv17-like protein n=1 Tax=Frankliniella fusca TaxID=407009 RepID=A0AAE1HM67_9NEOP|nr:Mpv17-like protein [Frankliniella fusca]
MVKLLCIFTKYDSYIGLDDRVCYEKLFQLPHHVITLTYAADNMALRLVKHVFAKYPVTANAVTFGSLYVTAELSQQVVTKKVLAQTPEPIDTAALGRYAIFGCGVGSHMLYFWYKWLDKRYVGTAASTILKKVLMDQFIMTPQLLVAFYLTMAVLERREDLFEEMRSKYLKTFQTSCLFWLPVQTVNFVLVPPAARVVYVGTSSLVWANILCWIKRQPQEQPEEQKQDELSHRFYQRTEQACEDMYRLARPILLADSWQHFIAGIRQVEKWRERTNFEFSTRT